MDWMKQMTKREKFILDCAQYIGLPYIWGGDNPKKGLDCSGYVQVILAKYGLDPSDDQTADELMKYFLSHGKRVAPSDIRLGDLLFYGSQSRATHIAIAIDQNMMFEAGGGGSSCTTPEAARKLGAQIRIASIYRRSDLVCAIRPNGLNLEA